jgi:hypothetical protein
MLFKVISLISSAVLPLLLLKKAAEPVTMLKEITLNNI